jgi:hypothetical protein
MSPDRKRILTTILGVVRMKRKAVLAKVKTSGPVQRRIWLREPADSTQRVFLFQRAALDRPADAYTRERHRATVFTGLDQHLNSKPPLRAIVS